MSQCVSASTGVHEPLKAEKEHLIVLYLGAQFMLPHKILDECSSATFGSSCTPGHQFCLKLTQHLILAFHCFLLCVYSLSRMCNVGSHTIDKALRFPVLVVLRSLSGFPSARPCVLFHPNHPIGVVVDYTPPLSLTDLSVSITIVRTDPPDFVGGPNDYRAASAVSLTCQVEGSGTTTYLWSSTCTGPSGNCFVPGRTDQTLARGTLRSTDSGSHICTATRGALTGSATIEMNVVGE